MRKKRSSGFPTRSDTDRRVESQEQARSLKFRMHEEEELYYQCSENKDTDTVTAQLICAFVFA